jgi:hypothetical protein
MHVRLTSGELILGVVVVASLSTPAAAQATVRESADGVGVAPDSHGLIESACPEVVPRLSGATMTTWP